MKIIVTNCDKVLTNEFGVNIGANVINCNKVLIGVDFRFELLYDP